MPLLKSTRRDFIVVVDLMIMDRTGQGIPETSETLIRAESETYSKDTLTAAEQLR